MDKMLVVVAIIAVAFAGCTDKGSDNPQVLFETSVGDFTVELWPDLAPVTVENFLRYVDEGHYDGLTFHRIAPGFVVQGGGYEPDHTTLRPTNPPIVNEASEDVPNEQWTLSMARTNAPDSATSQFFINLDDNDNLDKTGFSAGYAVFGKVIEGTTTVQAMTEVEAGQSFGAGGFWPKEPIVIEKATIIQGEAPAPLPPPTPADVSADTITPGDWHISTTDDEIMVYALNSGEAETNVTWSLTGPDGSALPMGWNASFEDGAQTLAGEDAVHTMLTITVPEDASGEHELELHTGSSTTSVTATVALDGQRISRSGDAITASYRGYCTIGEREFDSGEFPLTLGQGRAVPGFDFGLIGLAQGETTTIVFPGPLGYGMNDTRTNCEDGALSFDVELLEFE